MKKKNLDNKYIKKKDFYGVLLIICGILICLVTVIIKPKEFEFLEFDPYVKFLMFMGAILISLIVAGGILGGLYLLTKND